MAWTLAKKRALVTGGTKGIGRAIVEELLELGAEVLFVARDATAVADTETALRAQNLPAFGLAADVSTPEGRQRVFDAITERGGALDILVNNVGTNIRKSILEYSDDEYRHIFDTNLHSSVQLCRLMLPLLQQGRFLIYPPT